MGTYLAVRKGIKDKQIPPNLTQRKVNSRGGETLQLQPKPSVSVYHQKLQTSCWQPQPRAGCGSLMLPPSPFSLAGRRESGDEVWQSPGRKQPSMEGVEEQQDGADADDAAQDEGIPSLPEVDPLDQAVHCWKTVCQGIHLALYWLQHPSLRSHIFFCCHGNAYCFFYQSIWVAEVLVLLQEQLCSPVVHARAAFIRLDVFPYWSQQILPFSYCQEVCFGFVEFVCVILQDVPVALQRVHQRRVQRRHARTVGVLCHLVIYPSQLSQKLLNLHSHGLKHSVLAWSI